MERDIEYEISHVISLNDIEEVKCKNYELCGGSNIKEYLHLYEWGEYYLCVNCHIQFNKWGINHEGMGVLNFSDNIECPVCLEIKRGITQPRCSHWICIECFKRCYYGEDHIEPVFPYPNIENEYYDDVDNAMWEQQYPLIKTYLDECELYEETITMRLKQEDNLQLCPLCRA